MRSILLLLAVLSVLAMQRGDTGLRVTAKVCADPKCKELRVSGLEPVTLAVWVYVARDLGDRMVYGVVCDGIEVARTHVDVRENPAPVYLREYRSIGADGEKAECYGVALLQLRDGSQIQAQSDRLIIFGRG